MSSSSWTRRVCGPRPGRAPRTGDLLPVQQLIFHSKANITNRVSRIHLHEGDFIEGVGTKCPQTDRGSNAAIVHERSFIREYMPAPGEDSSFEETLSDD